MTASELAEFLSQFDFEHKAEIIPLLGQTPVDFSYTPASGTELDVTVKIYQQRYKHLSAMDGDHPKKLAAEIDYFLTAAQKNGVRQLGGAILSKDPNIIFIIFILDNPMGVFCLRSYDKTKTDDSTWNQLWSKKR